MLTHAQLIAISFWIRQRQKARRKRRYYVRPAHFKKISGSFRIFERYYESDDPFDLEAFCRLTPEKFDQLYSMIEHRIGNHARTHARPITGKQRLAVFLRYLSQGLSYRALADEFQIGKKTASLIVYEVCDAICSEMGRSQLPLPKRQEWLQNAEEFEDLGFPRAIGAMDGKHFWIRQPTATGSGFYNYKGFFSIVLLAVVDANCRFLLIDIGASGRNSDSSLFQSSSIRRYLESPSSEIPAPIQLANVGEVPYVVLADGGFGLSDYVLTPFPLPTTNTPERANFNNQLSRSRRVVENAFGQLVHRFRLFLRILEVDRKRAAKLIHAAVILHNFLGPPRNYMDIGDIDHHRRERQRRPASTQRSRIYRDRFVQYFANQ